MERGHATPKTTGKTGTAGDGAHEHEEAKVKDEDVEACNCDQALAAVREADRLRAELVTCRGQLAELFAAVMEAERPAGGYRKTHRLAHALGWVRDGKPVGA